MARLAQVDSWQMTERRLMWYHRQRRLLRRLRGRPVNAPLGYRTTYTEPHLAPINPTKRP